MHINSERAPHRWWDARSLFMAMRGALHDELPKASGAEADVTQALLAEAHVDGWLV